MLPLSAGAEKAFTETFYLAFVAYREARNQTLDCRAGVMWTLLNRAQRPSWWGRSIARCAVRKFQYSSLTDPRDRQLTVWPVEGEKAWFECLDLARHVYAGLVPHPMPGADSYHDVSIQTPATMATGRYCGQIGAIKFFDVDHDFESDLIAQAHDAANGVG